MLVLFRLFNIYASLQTSILSYRSIEIQPIQANETPSNLGKVVANVSESSKAIRSDEIPSDIPSDFSSDISNDISNDASNNAEISDHSKMNSKDDSSTIFDPIIKMDITVEKFNLYGLEELMHFKGIGEKTAQAIIDYRELHGEFTDFKALLSVKGIGEKKLEQLLNGR
ncbi:helix-hairpin-helix domain-containing protein [Fusibacter sp. Q10-2]|uniref:Helix-hairpin-helix domain-containing protein n=2 Tax=Fusibacter ferrireducens TaxID=2785058 RepID=A0ABR9ZWN8_9FIRM|nr:helix-hairpin-helix domain-containing protein [Fusibacter ferrireducens]